MPVRYGGDVPDPINTETEYAGKVPLPNSVQELGPTDEGRKLSTAEKLRLGYLTGQMEDPLAPTEPGFMGGVDSKYPEHPELTEYIPDDYRSEDYVE